MSSSLVNNARVPWKSRLFIALIVLFVVFVRVRLLEFPLERDEGEYAYMGQLMLQGIPPYLNAYNMKFPGTYVMYALIMAVFGQSIQGIHLGFVVVNCVSILLVYLLARKIVSESAALAAGASYALLSLSPSVLGFAAHATHFVVLPALGGGLALLYALRKDEIYAYCLSGALLGLAFLMKQPGLFFFLFGATYILYHHFSLTRKAISTTASSSASPSPLGGDGNAMVPSSVSGVEYNITRPPLRVRGEEKIAAASLRGGDESEGGLYCVTNHRVDSLKRLVFKLGAFSLSGALPLLITVVYLYSVGAFDRFWFWTMEYASKYGAQIPFSGAFDIFKTNVSEVVDGFLFLWVMAILGFIGLFFYGGMKGKRVFVVLFALSSFLTVCPGFYFRSHYFVTFLPALSILIGICIQWVDSMSAALSRTRYPVFAGIVIFLFSAGAGIASQREYLFEKNPVELSRIVYGANPFPESIEIAEFIASRSDAADRVAVFGSEPQIFFYSGRHSATGYIYTYSLMERHEYSLLMQEEMIREVMSSKPKFIVVVKIDTSWLMRPDSEKYIFGWLSEYIRTDYTLVGIADIISDETTVYRWDGNAEDYAIQSPYHVLIFEKAGK
jgi:hypothetical protein